LGRTRGLITKVNGTSKMLVVRSDGKGACPGVYLGHPIPGRYKYRDLGLQVGGISRIGTINYGLETCET
jgi:hypothetical protein